MKAQGPLLRQMLARLRAAMELRHLSAVDGATAADEAAFARYAAELTANYTVVGASFMVVAILAWWPVDWIVRPDARYLEGFAFMRTYGLVLEIVTAAVFLVSRRVRRASLVLAPLFHAALLGWIGYALGRIGGAELSWLADAAFGIIPAAVVPQRLRPRVAATAAISLVLPAGFFLPFPENRGAPAATGQLSFVVFSFVGTVVLGEILYRVLRRSYFQQRALHRARAGLAEVNDALADRIAAQERELDTLARHMERVQEAERRRISRDLHDELAQELTAMRYALSVMEKRCDRDPESVDELIADLTALLDGTTATVHGFISELRPRELDDLGLVTATERLSGRIQADRDVVCRLRVSGRVRELDARLDRETKLVLFRVIQEATTNARKHARARAIEISLDARNGEITAEVSDDGAGFDPSVPTTGFGLLGLRERARGAGGRLVLDSSPGRGTRVAATIPARVGAAVSGSAPSERKAEG